jgi:uncharacterized OsmC-like protein
MSEQVQGGAVVNGVDVVRMAQTIEAVRGRPELADFKFRAKNHWVGGGHNRIRVDGYYGTCQELKRQGPFVLDADEPPVLLGTDRGVNPVEYLLAALSSCMTTSLAYHGAAQGIEVEAIESDYEGDIDLRGFLGVDAGVRKGYREIRVTFKVKSDADVPTLGKIVRYSPVFDVVTNPTPVKISFVKA